MSWSDLAKVDSLNTIPWFVWDAKLWQVKIDKVGGDTKSQAEQILVQSDINEIIDYVQANPILVKDIIEKELGRKIDEGFEISVMDILNTKKKNENFIYFQIIENGIPPSDVYTYIDLLPELQRRVTTMKRLKQEE